MHGAFSITHKQPALFHFSSCWASLSSIPVIKKWFSAETQAKASFSFYSDWTWTDQRSIKISSTEHVVWAEPGFLGRRLRGNRKTTTAEPRKHNTLRVKTVVMETEDAAAPLGSGPGRLFIYWHFMLTFFAMTLRWWTEQTKQKTRRNNSWIHK